MNQNDTYEICIEGGPRERWQDWFEGIELMAEGLSNQQVAERLFISLPTVKKHTGNLFAKLNVNSRTRAIARAQQLKLI